LSSFSDKEGWKHAKTKKHFGWIYSCAPQRRKHFKLCGMGIVHPAVHFAAFFHDRSGMEDGSGKITPVNLPAIKSAENSSEKQDISNSITQTNILCDE